MDPVFAFLANQSLEFLRDVNTHNVVPFVVNVYERECAQSTAEQKASITCERNNTAGVADARRRCDQSVTLQFLS